MDQDNYTPGSNLPPALQEQLRPASQQVRGGSYQARGGNHQHPRPDQRLYRTPSRRGINYQRGERPSSAAGEYRYPNQPSFQSVRGRGSSRPHRSALSSNHSPYHMHSGGPLGAQSGRKFPPAPPTVVHQPFPCAPSDSERTFTVDPDSSSFKQVSSGSAPRLSPLAGRESEESHAAHLTNLHANEHHNSTQPQAITEPSISSSDAQTPSITHLPRSEIDSVSSPNTSHLGHQTLSQPTSARRPVVSPQSAGAMSFETFQAFHDRATRGAYRGRGSVSPRAPSYRLQKGSHDFMTDQNAPAHAFVSRSFTQQHRPGRRLGEQDTHLPNEVERKCSYLSFLADREDGNQISPQGLLERESFRKELEKIVQQLILDYAKSNTIRFDPRKMKLKCYGSLASGLGVSGSDMDLLLLFPKDNGPVGPIQVEARRMIEKGFLDAGYGARLLVKTRVPILRVCQSPSPELLAKLREERERWEEEVKEAELDDRLSTNGVDSSRLPATPPEVQSAAALAAFAELDTEPSAIPLPPSPLRAHADLEFKDDVGIQCDINFSNYVAIHNTALLRCYCHCDPRVRAMGLFVKAWAKARKINTPYHGTLSSYGYIMMVLHFLMNIVQPPVIPNLQHLAKMEDASNNKSEVELFEGFDVRFIRDEVLLVNRARSGQMTENQESLASLLCGFFRYYSAPRGFFYLEQVISIRTQGGVLTKKSKDWMQSKLVGVDNNVRVRYFLAIEDPFEVDHNIARTVCHSGLFAIRGEFSRAWEILSKIRYSEGRWLWYLENGLEGEDLFTVARDRGDLLRKDQLHNREKWNKMRAVEALQDQKSKSTRADTANLASNPHGMSPPPFRPSDRKGEKEAAESQSGARSLKLINPGRHAQNPVYRNEAKSSKKETQENGPRTTKVYQAEPINIQKASRLESHEVTKGTNATSSVTRAKGSYADQSGKVDAVSLLNGNAEPTTKHMAVDADVPQTANPVSASTDNAGNSHEPTTPEIILFPVIDKTNPLSAWDLTTTNGRWLNWRDSKIIAGAWEGHMRPEFEEVHRLHPFNEARDLAVSSTPHAAADIRAQRFGLLQAKKIGKGDTGEIQYGGDTATDQEHKESEIAITKCPALFVAKCRPPHVRTRPGDVKKLPEEMSTSDYTLELASNDPEVTHLPDSQSIPKAVNAQPARFFNYNLYENRWNFPIPSTPNFQFDPVQLRDLETIAEGGDGCARDTTQQNLTT